jgi:ParB/RepB/Spo0J family partition protein
MKTLKENIEIDTKNLKANPVNLQVYGDEGIDYSLIDSIEENGQLEPLVVIEDKKVPGTYIIISGHRRWTALQVLGKKANCRLISFESDELEMTEAESEMTEAIIEFNKYRKKIFTNC